MKKCSMIYTYFLKSISPSEMPDLSSQILQKAMSKLFAPEA